MRSLFPKDLFTGINPGKLLRYFLYLVACLVAQNILMTQLRILGVCPLLTPAVAVAMGMFEGATWGPLFSLLLGVFSDMAFVENTVFFTLVLPALSFVAAFVANYYINRRFFAFMGAAAAGLAVTALGQVMKTAASDSFSVDMVTTAVLQTLWSLPFAAVVYLPPARISRADFSSQ